MKRVIVFLLLISSIGFPIRNTISNNDLNGVNYILGTQTFGVKYKFTQDTGLVETANRIYKMGSNILKFTLSNRTMIDQYYDIPYNANIHSLIELASNEPSVKAVLDMPFTFCIMWAYPFGQADNAFTDGLSASEATNMYNEIYDLSVHLLQSYNDSGKTFFLGHWEGDWYIHPNYDPNAIPTDLAVNGMIDWLNVRQQAVDDAKNNTVFTNVQIYNYAEVNLVQKGMQGDKCMANNVLPFVNVDYVSYSCYDTINLYKGNVSNALYNALDYIESKMPPKENVPGKRVFIGEYGFALENVETPEIQNNCSKDVCRAALGWGAPFILYWEMYCNETNNFGEHRGYGLIDDKNRKQLFYYTLKSYNEIIKLFIEDFRKNYNRYPNDEEIRQKALEILDGEITNVYEAADNSAALSVQPLPDDLSQFGDVRINLIKGNTNNHFNLGTLFNSDASGSYGAVTCLFPDGLSPENDTVIQYDFGSPKIIDEIHVFSRWGDLRLFTWFEVWISTTGTNDTDYTKMGVASFGKKGDLVASYANKYCVARLYNNSEYLVSGVMSIRLVQKNSGYNKNDGTGIKEDPGTPLGSTYSAVAGSAVLEIDIIGNGIPEPALFWILDFGFLILYFTKRRISNVLIK